MFITFVMKLEELYEGRLSRTVLWEREGETPSRDPIIGKRNRRHNNH